MSLYVVGWWLAVGRVGRYILRLVIITRILNLFFFSLEKTQKRVRRGTQRQAVSYSVSYTELDGGHCKEHISATLPTFFCVFAFLYFFSVFFNKKKGPFPPTSQPTNQPTNHIKWGFPPLEGEIPGLAYSHLSQAGRLETQ